MAVTDNGARYWVAADRIAFVWPEGGEVVARATGADMLGAGYEPPFDYFGHERDRGAFRVIASSDVTTEEGTGLVHMAPAYGEADFLALQAAGLDVLVDPVDYEGRFTDEVPDVAGLNVKEADAPLMRLLDARERPVQDRTHRAQLSVLLAHGHTLDLQGDSNVVRQRRVDSATVWPS